MAIKLSLFTIWPRWRFFSDILFTDLDVVPGFHQLPSRPVNIGSGVSVTQLP
jgi:hypothetical protein